VLKVDAARERVETDDWWQMVILPRGGRDEEGRAWPATCEGARHRGLLHHQRPSPTDGTARLDPVELRGSASDEVPPTASAAKR